VLDLLATLAARSGTAVLFVTHDLGVLAQVADHVAVLAQGRVVEQAPVATLYDAPAHDVTRRLLAASRELGVPPRGVA
jgi:ABC-type dipeptide/oligopeptide/nickel transport system ATPase component